MEPGDLAGNWHGTWRTWVEPGELYDEGPIAGVVEAIHGGRGAVFRYQASLDGHVDGYAVIAATQDGPVVAWLDTWHTGGLAMVSHGEPRPDEITVATTYRAEGQQWRWTSEYRLGGAGRFEIRHYNEGPDLPRYLGVEAIMERD